MEFKPRWVVPETLMEMGWGWLSRLLYRVNLVGRVELDLMVDIRVVFRARQWVITL